MTALDKLRKLDDAASPGPRETQGGYNKGKPCKRCGAAPIVTQFGVLCASCKRANAQLAALSHLLRPMAEALENAPCEVTGKLSRRLGDHGAEMYCTRCAVLAKLEEALR